MKLSQQQIDQLFIVKNASENLAWEAIGKNGEVTEEAVGNLVLQMNRLMKGLEKNGH